MPCGVPGKKSRHTTAGGGSRHTHRVRLRAEKCGGWHRGAVHVTEEVGIPMPLQRHDAAIWAATSTSLVYGNELRAGFLI